MAERIVPIPLESLQLIEGSHAYLLKDQLLTSYETEMAPTLEMVQAKMEQEAQFTETVRKHVEDLGGRFNGIRTFDVKISDARWMGPMPHRLTFLLADFF